MKAIPAHRGKLISGSHGELIAGPADFYTRIAWQHEGIVKFRIFHRWIYAIADPELLHLILVTRQKSFPKSRAYQNLEQVIGRGLVTLQGETWVNDRRIIQPGFHQKCIVGVVETTNRACDRIFAQWNGETASATSAASAPYRPVVPAMREIGLQVIAETLLGTTLASAQSAHLSENLLAAGRDLLLKNWSLIQLPEHWPTPINRRLKAFRLGMLAFLAEQVERRLAEGVGQRGDMLDLLLSAHAEGAIPKDRVLSEMLTLFSAGYDTTSSALSWSIYYLALHPEWQEKLRAEIHRELGSRPPAWEDLARLSLVEATFNEAIRLKPPVHTISRTNPAAEQIGDYVLPAGSLLVLSLHAANRSPRHWDRPHEFDPSRAPGAPEAVGQNLAWLPFSSGSRRCIGAQFATVEAKIVLARLVQTYRFELQPDTPVHSAISASQHPEQLFVRFTHLP